MAVGSVVVPASSKVFTLDGKFAGRTRWRTRFALLCGNNPKCTPQIPVPQSVTLKVPSARLKAKPTQVHKCTWFKEDVCKEDLWEPDPSPHTLQVRVAKMKQRRVVYQRWEVTPKTAHIAALKAEDPQKEISQGISEVCLPQRCILPKTPKFVGQINGVEGDSQLLLWTKVMVGGYPPPTPSPH